MTVPKSPYPWFGGKSSIAALVWARLGNVRNFVDPFLGSCAFLLGRPEPWEGTETVNDADGMVSNFWRAIQADPAATAKFADWPVNENDLHARHVWLRGQRENLVARLEGDPDYFDPKIAGWWVWGQCCWIGAGWCDETTTGPWSVVEVDGHPQLVRLGNAGRGVKRQLVHLGNAGRGVNRQLVHLGTAGQGVNRKRVHLGDAGCGVNRKRVHIATHGIGRGVCADRARGDLESYFAILQDRLRDVRVCSGDWSRVCGPTPTIKQGLTGIVLDPPYSHQERDPSLYAEDHDVSADVRRWCIDWTDDARMRIALFGYEGEGHEELDGLGWDCVAWKTQGGYAGQGAGDSPGANNSVRERIWFSPSCLSGESLTPLFDLAGETE